MFPLAPMCVCVCVCVYPPSTSPLPISTRPPQGKLPWQTHFCSRASSRTQETWYVCITHIHPSTLTARALCTRDFSEVINCFC